MLRDVRDTAPDIIFRDVDSDLCKHTVYLRRGAMNQSTMEFNSDTWHDTRGKCEKPMGTHKQYPQLEPKWLRTHPGLPDPAPTSPGPLLRFLKTIHKI